MSSDPLHNLGPRGVRSRLTGGVVMLLVTLGMAVTMLLLPVGRWWRLLLFPAFWVTLLAFLQALLVIQLLVGIVVLTTGRRADSILHYLYGVVFPTVVLVIAHVLARGMDDESDTWRVFAIAAFFVFGLTLRALTTGLGLP